jgi:hypothetical protein
MKKLPKKGVLLFAAAMALCAFAMAPMAGAASWTALGSEHTLDSPDFGFTATTAVGAVTAQCTQSSLTATVSSATNLSITAASFGGHCAAHGPAFGTCTVTELPVTFPWTATGISTSNVQIHQEHITVVFHQWTPHPTCNVAGEVWTLVGTPNSGTSFNNTERALIFSNAEGMTAQSAALGTFAVTLRGTFRDTQQTLSLDS